MHTQNAQLAGRHGVWARVVPHDRCPCFRSNTPTQTDAHRCYFMELWSWSAQCSETVAAIICVEHNRLQARKRLQAQTSHERLLLETEQSFTRWQVFAATAASWSLLQLAAQCPRRFAADRSRARQRPQLRLAFVSTVCASPTSPLPPQPGKAPHHQPQVVRSNCRPCRPHSPSRHTEGNPTTLARSM